MDRIDLTGKVAIVTGAGGGLGRSHAQQLAERGASVVVNDIAGADTAVTELRASNLEATANSADISTPEGAADLVNVATAAYGRVDILINNAGVGRFAPLTEMSVEEYQLVRGAGLDGAFYVTREAWPIMVDQGYGRIMMTSSGAGMIGDPNCAAYGIAKAGVYGLMRSCALEGEPLGIKANAIAPAAFTPMAQQFAAAEAIEGLQTRFPTSLVSPVVVLLASEQCPSNGALLDVFGGRVGSTFVATTPGMYDPDLTPESILAAWPKPVDRTQYVVYKEGIESPGALDWAEELAKA